MQPIWYFTLRSQGTQCWTNECKLTSHPPPFSAPVLQILPAGMERHQDVDVRHSCGHRMGCVRKILLVCFLTHLLAEDPRLIAKGAAPMSALQRFIVA